MSGLWTLFANIAKISFDVTSQQREREREGSLVTSGRAIHINKTKYFRLCLFDEV